MKTTLPPGYFDDIYNKDEDPWRFETSPYEKAKYEATIQALPRSFYTEALEIGCSIGVLTEMLAPHCAHLLSTDISEVPLRKACRRLQDLPHVSFRQAAIPEQYPAGRFDLVVMSEVGYYLSMEDLRLVKEKIVQSLLPGGHLVLVHWLPVVPDYPLTGDEVHEVFLQPDDRLRSVSSRREEKYRMDVIGRTGVAI